MESKLATQKGPIQRIICVPVKCAPDSFKATGNEQRTRSPPVPVSVSRWGSRSDDPVARWISGGWEERTPAPAVRAYLEAVDGEEAAEDALLEPRPQHDDVVLDVHGGDRRRRSDRPVGGERSVEREGEQPGEIEENVDLQRLEWRLLGAEWEERRRGSCSRFFLDSVTPGWALLSTFRPTTAHTEQSSP